MKNPLFIWILLACYTINTSYSQSLQSYSFGEPSAIERSMQRYEKDSTASVVILYDQGVYEYEQVGQSLKLVKTIYKKIKVFDAKNFDRMIDQIPLVSSNEQGERLVGFHGFIHSGSRRRHLTEQELLPSYEEGIGRVVNLLVPHVDNGSIIEYKYQIESPFLFHLDGWNFQDVIPKLYSEVIVKQPAGFSFSNSLYGNEELYLNLADWRKDCLQTLPNAYTFRCPIYLYAMKDVPAFQVEDYMLSPKNYLARIDFEPKSVISNKNFKGMYHFSTTWKDVDKRFKKDLLFGKQLREKKYFKRQTPDSILSITDELTRAKAVYGFIRDRFEWNGILYNYGATIREIFEAKTGSAAEINISLINALQAAGLDAKLMMISTRENGLPTILHPVMTKFNYAIVYLP